MVRVRPGLFCESEEMARRANIPPSICWPSNWGILAPDRPSVSVAEADDCSAPPLFLFGSEQHRLSLAAWCPDHNSPNTREGKGKKGDGCRVENEKKKSILARSCWIFLNLY